MSNPAFDNEHKLGTVEGKVRDVVLKMGENIEYRFMNWAQANVDFDKINKPTIVYILPPSGDFYIGRQEIKDYPEAQIAFVCSTEFDFESDENDALVEQMKRLCMRFINAINESGYFVQLEGKLPYQVLYDHLDENVTGVVITPILEEEEGVSICEDSDIYNPEELEND
ncbi:hypothetical protein [uncultured Duncaniella sp.]|jgi:hypothetical protein|uniref:hypothetical protein n=1 Tax=uncultured Duncaniella sp. TaxID=2768039 RepID=UPI0025B6B48C|nr:hypothetical protein [uncultured Duncaniella sp.]